VDVSVLQSISYIVTAIGVCIAAGYYVLNLRETTKNRHITFTNSVMQQLYSEEGVRREVDCYMMQWRDFDDFMKKYDSRVNLENYSKRMSLWYQYDMMGYLYKSGLIDLDTVANVGGSFPFWDWFKFKPIIEEYRKTDIGPRGLSNWEYLAEAVMRAKESYDPGVRDRVDRVQREHRLAQ
jgi:hypothetical protein